MYLNECLIQNVGPIELLDASFPMNQNGTPKPVVLVGRNGSGKSILISHIVDALVEFAKCAFSDIVSKKHFAASPYFKITGFTNQRMGEMYGLSLLQFSDGESTCCFVDKTGKLEPSSMTSVTKGRFSDVMDWPVDGGHKKISPQSKELFEQFFDRSAACYFPASRHERPHWLNNEFADESDLFSFTNRIKGRLDKPIVVERGARSTIAWLLSVLTDALVEVKPINQIPYGLPGQATYKIIDNLADKSRLMQSKANIDAILRNVIGNENAIFKLNYRNNPFRLSIDLGEGRGVPSIEHLSSGEAILFNTFATIIRYGERRDVLRSVKLQEIEGIVLIDEIDAHMHVDLQFDVLPRLISLFPKVQFILTSHSPLFLCGMEKRFGVDGVHILELPCGSEISTEHFSEFQQTFECFKQSKTFEEEITVALNETEKPIVFTEGETDVAYIQAALVSLDRKDLLDHIDLRCIGTKTNQGSKNSGKSALNQARNFLASHTDLMKRRVLLLYDCDANKSPEDDGSIIVRAIPRNDKNKKVKDGIENLLPESLFEDRFYSEKVEPKGDGGMCTIIKLKKTQFCEWICEQRNDPSDFEQFRSIVEILENFVREDALLPQTQIIGPNPTENDAEMFQPTIISTNPDSDDTE